MEQQEELNVSDKEAKKIIEGALAQLKAQGMQYVNVIDLHEMTQLPYDQLNKIMFILEKSGVVTDST